MFLFLILAQNDGNFAGLNEFNAKRTQFSDVFGTSNYVDSISNEERTGTNRFEPSKADASVANCLFHDCSSSSCGGAVYCSSSIERIFIEETTFTTCKTTTSCGGGIYFYNTNNGECVISRTCAFDCSSTCSSDSGGQFAYIETKKDAATCKNEVNETTITGIKKQASAYPHYALRLQYSNIICSSVNITNNECCYYTALYCCPNYDASAFTCCIIYTSIVNNSANGGWGCIYLGSSVSRQLISTSNIINNKQNTDGVATIYTCANLFINESCIIGNNEGKLVFSEFGRSCQIKITNCTLDQDIVTESTRYSGTLTIISSKDYFFINALRHIVTGKCESSFDSYGTLTAEVKTEKKENMNCSTIIPYCKCKKQQSICSLLR